MTRARPLYISYKGWIWRVSPHQWRLFLEARVEGTDVPMNNYGTVVCPEVRIPKDLSKSDARVMLQALGPRRRPPER